MALGKRQRRILAVLGASLGGLLALWVSAPLWYPWVLRPIAKKQGVHYSKYEREGYGRFALYGVGFTNQGIKLHVERIDAFVPTVWLWRRALATGREQEPFVRVSGWRFESVPSGQAGKGESSYSTVGKVRTIVQTVQKWLPDAALSNGSVRVQTTVIGLPGVTWSRGKVRAEIELLEQAQQLALSANLSNTQAWTFRILSDSLHLESDLQLADDSSGLKIQGTSLWWSNRIELDAQFGRAGALPDKASLHAKDFHLPAELAGLEGYRELSGSVAATWESGQFAMDAHAQATPQPGQTNLPPATLDLRARGDTNSATSQSATS